MLLWALANLGGGVDHTLMADLGQQNRDVWVYPRVYPTRPVYPRVRVGSGRVDVSRVGYGCASTGMGIPGFTRK